MRRTLVMSLLALAACAKKEQQADTTSAAATPPGGTSAATAPAANITNADVAGTWEAKAMPMNKDTVATTFEMTATSTMNGWSMKLPNGEKPAVRVVAIQGDSVVSDAGPFKSVLRKGQQVTVHTIMHLRDGKLTGTTHAKYSNGDTATLRVEATKKAGQ
jgi:predicted secreted protein